MKKTLLSLLFVGMSTIPTLSYAKGVPMFFQTGDELFEIEGAPVFEDGFSVGYACQRFGLFGADVWTWDCEIMAVNLEAFSAGELEPEIKAEMEAQFSLGDRVRNPWNHYGAVLMGLVFVGGAVVKTRR